MSKTVLNFSSMEIVSVTFDMVEKLKEWIKSDAYCRKTKSPRM
jgi:hypothetical protein